MTNVNKLHILLVLLLGAGAIAYFSMRINDEERIIVQIAELTQLASMEKSESILKMAATASRIASLCDDPFRLEADSISSSGELKGQEITQRIAQIRGIFNTLQITTHDINVQFRGKEAAAVLCFATVNGNTPAAGPINREYRVHCIMIKRQDTWLFSEVTFTPTTLE